MPRIVNRKKNKIKKNFQSAVKKQKNFARNFFTNKQSNIYSSHFFPGKERKWRNNRSSAENLTAWFYIKKLRENIKTFFSWLQEKRTDRSPPSSLPFRQKRSWNEIRLRNRREQNLRWYPRRLEPRPKPHLLKGTKPRLSAIPAMEKLWKAEKTEKTG